MRKRTMLVAGSRKDDADRMHEAMKVAGEKADLDGNLTILSNGVCDAQKELSTNRDGCGCPARKCIRPRYFQ